MMKNVVPKEDRQVKVFWVASDVGNVDFPEKGAWQGWMDDLVVIGVALAAEVGRSEREGGLQRICVAEPDAGAVEGGQQPLVRVGVEAVGQLDAPEVVALLRQDRGHAGMCAVHMQPA